MVGAPRADHVRQCTPRPVLLRGGDKGEESAVLQYAADLINAGASGLVYGRNIIHHEDPRGITRKFMKKVHGDSWGGSEA